MTVRLSRADHPDHLSGYLRQCSSNLTLVGKDNEQIQTSNMHLVYPVISFKI